MNCANCPAARGLGPWNFSQCTLDYFAHIGSFNRAYQTVEAGIQDLPWYQRLTHAVVPRAGMADHESVEVLHASQSQVAEMRITVDEKMCAYVDHIDLVRTAACRDDAWARVFGESCWPPGQQLPQRGTCVINGFICCANFYGWSEKLEYFSGVAWDLPCDCGLRSCGDCCTYSSVERVNHLYPLNATPASPCSPFSREDAPETNMPEWTLAASSTLLRGLAMQTVSPETAWAACENHYAVRHPEATALPACDAAFLSFLRASGSDTTPWVDFAESLRRKHAEL
jgi:hypothetical protein